MGKEKHTVHTLTLHRGAHKTSLKPSPFSLYLRPELLEVEPHIQLLCDISSGSKTHATVH